MILTSRSIWNNAANVGGHFSSEVKVDVVQDFGVCLVHNGIVAMAELERDGSNDVCFLVRSKRVVEQLRLIKVFLELVTTLAQLDTLNCLRETTS